MYTQSVGLAVATLATNGKCVTEGVAGRGAFSKAWQTAKLLQSQQSNSVALSPDRQLLASASSFQDKTIQIWNLKSGQVYRTLDGHNDSVVAIAFTADGQTLVSGSSDCTIKIWDLGSGTVLTTLANVDQDEVNR